MTDKRERFTLNPFTLAIVVLTLSLGCLCLPTGIIPTSTPTNTPTSTPTNAPTNTPTFPLLPVITDTPIVSSVLNAEGPWLLIETDRGLWATNPDGSGLRQLTDVDYWDAELQPAIQPGGNLVVFLSPVDYDFHHMTLNLLSLPDGKISKITDLTSPETEAYADSTPGSDGFEPLRAVRERHNFAWAPDGTRLAFVGVMDGPTAEIYLYETASGKIQRVSTDDAQNYWPSWSPDGNTLLYFGTQGFGSGAGFDTSGVWSAAGDGSTVTRLYVPASGVEEVAGWLDNSTVVMDTWTAVCGPQALRLYDLTSRKVTMLNQGCLTSATADGYYGAALFSNDSGLYLVTPGNPTPLQVDQTAGARIDPREPGDQVFTVRFGSGGIATYGINEYDHQVSPVTASPLFLDVAEYGAIWGWTSEDEAQPGAWITGPGIEIGQIFEGRARFPIWDEHNNLLFFAQKGGNGYSLYRTTFEAYYQDLSEVTFVDAGIRVVAWMGYP